MGRPINSVVVLLLVFEYPRTLRGGRGPRRREVRPRRRELRLEAGDVRREAVAGAPRVGELPLRLAGVRRKLLSTILTIRLNVHVSRNFLSNTILI